MTITFSGGVRAVDTSTASATKTVVLGADVPAGATIQLEIFNRTNETATLDQVSDPVNGNWDLGTCLRQGPSDNAATTGRSWVVSLINSAALTGAGNRTISIVTSAGVSTQICGVIAQSDIGVLTFVGMATLFNPAANTTDWRSSTNGNTIAVASAGCLICSSGWSNAVTIPNPTGTNEVLQTTVSDAGSYRANIWTKTFAAGGTYGLEVQTSATTTGLMHIAAYTEPGGSPAPTITNVDGDNVVTATQTNAVVNGTNFDGATLTFTQGLIDVVQDITNETATVLTFDVVFDAGVGPHLYFGSATATVENSDTQSDSQAITIAVPAGSAFTDLVDPLVDSGLRLTGIPDLAGGDQIWYYGVEGGGTIADVTVLANGSISVTPGMVTGFWARAFDPSTDTWGTPAFQDLAAAGTGGIGGSDIGQSDLNIGSGISGSDLSVEDMFYS